MDNCQLSDDVLDFQELLNFSFDLASSNSSDEISNQWLDELSLSIIFDNGELSARKILQQVRSAELYTKTVEVDNKQDRKCIDLGKNYSIEELSTYIELITLDDTFQDSVPLPQTIVDLQTRNIAFESPWMQNNHSIVKSTRPRSCLSKNELSVLEREFQICRYPDRWTRTKLALALNLTHLKVSEWFTNRRIKMRKQEADSFLTPDKYSEYISRDNRIHFSKMQIAMLEREFQICQNPDCLTRQKLALMLGLRDEQVNNWFHYQRNKMKKPVEQTQQLPVQPSLVHDNMSTFSAFETTFERQSLTEKADNNNNQLSTAENMLDKDQSRYYVVYESESTLNFTNQEVQEVETETSSFLSSAESNQDSNKKTSENPVQLVQFQSVICGVLSTNRPSQQRQRRIVYCRSQLEVLENQFKKCEYPNYYTICQLASKIKVSESQVRVWFKNRRAKQRKLVKCALPTQLETVSFSLSRKLPTQKHKNYRFSERQLIVLEREFKKCQHPDLVAICRLASKIKLTNSQVRRWYTVRRVKQRKLQKPSQMLMSRIGTSNFSSSSGSSAKKCWPRRSFLNTNHQATFERQFLTFQYPKCNTRKKLASTLNLIEKQEPKSSENRHPRIQKRSSNNQFPTQNIDTSNISSNIDTLNISPSAKYHKLRIRSRRTNFSKNHLIILENEFKKDECPGYNTLDRLVSMINVPRGKISNWFKNRRSKQRKLEKTHITTDTCKPRRPLKPRRRAERISFNARQLAILEHEFKQCQYLDYDTACSLAKIMNVPYDKVRTWFVNRRAKLKKLHKPHQFLQQQTQTAICSPSSDLQSIEAQCRKRSTGRLENNYQAAIIREDNGNNVSSNSIWHMSDFSQNLQCELCNNTTSPVFTQRGYDMPLIDDGIIDDDEFYINPAPPSAQYVLSFDAPVNDKNFIL